MSGTNAVAKMAAPKEEAWHYLKTFKHDKNTFAKIRIRGKGFFLV